MQLKIFKARNSNYNAGQLCVDDIKGASNVHTHTHSISTQTIPGVHLNHCAEHKQLKTVFNHAYRALHYLIVTSLYLKCE